VASHLLVRVDFVPTAPAGFQKYIETYFIKKRVLGQEVYSAVRYVNGPNHNYGRGAAPSHSVDLRMYEEGLPEGVSLCSWIHERTAEGQVMWEFHGGDDPREDWEYFGDD